MQQVVNYEGDCIYGISVSHVYYSSFCAQRFGAAWRAKEKLPPLIPGLTCVCSCRTCEQAWVGGNVVAADVPNHPLCVCVWVEFKGKKYKESHIQ